VYGARVFPPIICYAFERMQMHFSRTLTMPALTVPAAFKCQHTCDPTAPLFRLFALSLTACRHTFHTKTLQA